MSKASIVEVNLKIKLPQNYWRAFQEVAKQYPYGDEYGHACRTPESFITAFIIDNVRQVTLQHSVDREGTKIAEKYGIR